MRFNCEFLLYVMYAAHQRFILHTEGRAEYFSVLYTRRTRIIYYIVLHRAKNAARDDNEFRNDRVKYYVCKRYSAAALQRIA